jgi:hypothetical protein
MQAQCTPGCISGGQASANLFRHPPFFTFTNICTSNNTEDLFYFSTKNKKGKEKKKKE